MLNNKSINPNNSRQQTLAPLPSTTKTEYTLISFICALLVFVIYLLLNVLLIVDAIYHPEKLHALDTYRWSPFLLIFTLFAYSSGTQYFTYQRLNTNRQRALQGDQSLLASEQPQPLERLPEFPFVIEQKQTLKSYLFVLLFAIIFLSFYWFTFTVFFSSPNYLIWIIVSIVIVFFALIFYSWFQQKHTQLIATQDGLHMKQRLKETFIPWHEVRLFAIDTAPNLKKKGPPLLFELAGEKHIVQWHRADTTKTLFPLSSYQPIGSPKEYNHRMQQLLSIITSITKQPLYDLRKK